MEVHQHNFGSEGLEQCVRFAEWIVVVLHKDATLQIDDGKLLSGAGGALIPANPRNAFCVVRRPQHSSRTSGWIAVHRVEVLYDLSLVPNMIAGGQHLASQVEELIGDRRCKAETSGGILRIGDDQIDLMAFHHVLQVVAHNPASCAAEYIANEEDFHKQESLILTFRRKLPHCAHCAVVRKSDRKSV